MTLTATTGSTGEAGECDDPASSAFPEMTVSPLRQIALKVAEFITVEAASVMRMLVDYKTVPKFDTNTNGNGHSGNGKHADSLEHIFRHGLIYDDRQVDAIVLDLLQSGATGFKVLRIHTMDQLHPATLMRSLSRLEMLGYVRRDGTSYSLLP